MDDIQQQFDDLEKSIALYSAIRIALDEWMRGYGVKVDYVDDECWRVSVDGQNDDYLWNDISGAYRDAIVIASDIRVMAHLKDAH